MWYEKSTFCFKEDEINKENDHTSEKAAESFKGEDKSEGTSA